MSLEQDARRSLACDHFPVDWKPGNATFTCGKCREIVIMNEEEQAKLEAFSMAINNSNSFAEAMRTIDFLWQPGQPSFLIMLLMIAIPGLRDQCKLSLPAIADIIATIYIGTGARINMEALEHKA